MLDDLSSEKLRRECDPKLLRCETTEEIPPLEGIVGQKRAVRALKFGLDIEENGFNVYVAGQPGTGRMTAVKDFLEETAKTKPVPSDWCYVNNFKNPYEPKVIKLPSGKGKTFQNDMKNLINEVRRELPKAFQSEDYAEKREKTIETVEEERRELFEKLNRKAQKEGFIFRSTQVGLVLIPIVDGKPLSNEEFMRISPQKREEIKNKREKLHAELRSATRKLREQERKINEELQKLNREVALYAIGILIADLREKYKEYSDVVTHLEKVKDDILDNIDQFLGEPKQPDVPFKAPWMEELPFRKYEVNLLVDNSDLQGSPVIVELNPTHKNLFGRVEKEAQFGVLTTDFTMIRAGSLHKANGGYLVLPAEDILRNLFSWDGLKRALTNNRIMIEEAGERLGLITTKGLRPEPIPLNIKVLLIGKPTIYHLLYMLDTDFKELFKVKAEFDTTMDRTNENIRKYTAFICSLCKKEKLKHLDSSAVAKTVEYGSRLAENQEKLSTRFADLADILREANFYASQDNANYVTADHVKKAIEEKTYRSNLIQEKIQEMIQKDVLLIDTEEKVTGQVNGLSVMSLGDFAFGRPSRVTSSISLGREGVIDIEREAKLGGRIHTKGVMILSGYLAGKYAQDKPLTLSARLVFEQSYGMVEGDSASSTEVYAVLSALSGLPLKQGIAVTGSVNQKGEVQAIGGVNEKVEGFFEVCKVKGFTGEQGVIIPESNVQNLMLKEGVVEAVNEGKFHIWAVKNIDQGIEILTGVKAGLRRAEGIFEEGTVNYRVDKQLRQMAKKLKEFPEFVIKSEKKD
jgi:lon-related putative ATP-dependent protease